MADTTIKIDEEVRNHLRTVADERGISVRALAERALLDLPTEADRAERAARGLAYVRAHLRPDLTDDDVTSAEQWFDAIVAGTVGEIR
ncbi:hypothetical protein QMK19_29275 [Streptomyces sp. H10-C2]|uniref:hypothetical protein n=1 Tax=Streptomyces TaxID=1883 RepID=UPI0018DF8992|nr:MULTISPECIES: hypothetical protein [Streptomyces]MDJ0344212.1 hypothetical protein [Streptomyces sp. PH10-H1]MDJ0373642.1 hypothetical protein [Streptomyces sp. H10-C2]